MIRAMRSSDPAPDAALAGSPLGRASAYPERYDASLLFSLGRAPQRSLLIPTGPLPFEGADLWTAYELSWLGPRGLPQRAVLNLAIDAHSPAIVESKSLKLYLGSFSQTTIASSDELRGRIATDLSRACGADVRVALSSLAATQALRREELPGESLDGIDIAVATYQPDATLLHAGGSTVDETLRSSAFKSNCPVTGQPDYADILVRYRGPRIQREALLRYLVSYRAHAAFHEACVERIFVDIAGRCRPQRLTVYARFLRRGGIDINPFRSNFESAPSVPIATPRQ